MRQRVNDKSDKFKQTNDIKVAAPILSAIDIKGKNIPSDTLHTKIKFAVGVTKSKGVRNAAHQMRKLSFRPRVVLDYFKRTKNSQCAK